MELFILRHGQAESYAASDSQRALTPHGVREVESVLSQRKSSLANIKKIFVSPYVRAQQTADIVQNHFPGVLRIDTDLLVPSNQITSLLEMLQQEVEHDPDGSVLLVSHQPLVNILLDSLCGLARGKYSMTTAALASIKVEVFARDCCEFNWLQQAEV